MNGATLNYAGSAFAVALTLAGVLLLRASWSCSRPNRYLIAGGWIAISASFFVLTHIVSGEIAAAYGLLALALVAYATIFAGAEMRTRTARSSVAALEPEQRRTNWPRAIAKSLLAIVLAGIAAIGIGVAFAVAMPMGPHDRIVIGGLMVPVLWGAGMAWTLSDAKLLRATLILVSVSLVSYGIAFLPKLIPSS